MDNRYLVIKRSLRNASRGTVSSHCWCFTHKIFYAFQLQLISCGLRIKVIRLASIVIQESYMEKWKVTASYLTDLYLIFLFFIYTLLGGANPWRRYVTFLSAPKLHMTYPQLFKLFSLTCNLQVMQVLSIFFILCHFMRLHSSANLFNFKRSVFCCN